MLVFYRCSLSDARRRTGVLDADFTMEGNSFMTYLLERCHLTTGGRASACGAACHLEERQSGVSVDTHVYRTSRRLGLIGTKVTADQAHTVFARITPPEWVYPLHVNLIRHGRQICLAQRPRSALCPLYSECAFVGSVSSQEAAIPG
jgi:hypothetical protein